MMITVGCILVLMYMKVRKFTYHMAIHKKFCKKLGKLARKCLNLVPKLYFFIFAVHVMYF